MRAQKDFSKLPNLPQQIWSQILDFLPLSSVLELTVCGDRNFINHIGRSLRRMRLVRTQFRALKFPTDFLRLYSNLRELSIEVPDSTYEGPDRLSVSLLPSTLRSLSLKIKSLKFSRFFHTVAASSALAPSTPQFTDLTELKIQYCKVKVTDANLVLEKDDSSIIGEFLQNTPLSTLRISLIEVDPVILSYLPPTMNFLDLTLKFGPHDAVLSLPPLPHLSTLFLSSNSDYIWNGPLIPPKVTALSLQPNMERVNLFGELPTHLLSLSLPKHTLDGKDMSLLPPSLTSLEIAELDADNLSCLPRTLTSFAGFFCRLFQLEDALTLPPSLKQLSGLERVSMKQWAHLPRCLRGYPLDADQCLSLDLEDEDLHWLSHLPPAIVNIRLHHPTIDSLSAIPGPQNVRRLELVLSSGNVSFMKPLVLFESLEYLKIELSGNPYDNDEFSMPKINHSVLPLLTAPLKHLEIILICGVLENFRLPASCQTTLETLIINSCHWERNRKSDWFPQLRSLPSTITSLSIDFALDEGYLTVFPPTCTNLTFGLFIHDSFSFKQLQQLPRNIQGLSINFESGSRVTMETQLSDILDSLPHCIRRFKCTLGMFVSGVYLKEYTSPSTDLVSIILPHYDHLPFLQDFKLPNREYTFALMMAMQKVQEILRRVPEPKEGPK